MRYAALNVPELSAHAKRTPQRGQQPPRLTGLARQYTMAVVINVTMIIIVAM